MFQFFCAFVQLCYYFCFAELLENITLNSREYRETILPAIIASYKDRTVDRNFRHTNVWFVHNSDLTNKVSSLMNEGSRMKLNARVKEYKRMIFVM